MVESEKKVTELQHYRIYRNYESRLVGIVNTMLGDNSVSVLTLQELMAMGLRP